jgi:SAM-dependent methyltransferase
MSAQPLRKYCPVCGQTAKSMIKVFAKTHSAVRLQCETCKCIFFDAVPDTEKIYSHEYNMHFCRPSDAMKAGIMAAKLAGILFRFDHAPKMLEVGAGNGLTALLVNKLGYNVDMLEVSPEHAAFLNKATGLKCGIGRLEDLKIVEAYDLIYSSHVIEHTTKPHDFARVAYNGLRAGGIFYVDTPCVDLIHEQGNDWRHCKTRNEFEHVILYTDQGLRYTLRKAGFKILSCEHFEEYGSMQMVACKI